MKKISTIMLLAAFAFVGACASDDAVMNESEVDETVVTEQPAAEPAQAEEMKSDTMAQDSATMSEDAEDMTSDTDTSDTMSSGGETADTSAGSDNLVSTCTYGADTRVISVVYDNEETSAVCEVTYEKSTGVQTLWSANNERDYCLPKAKEFVEKQRGWGWECTDLQ
jgi:hypothetical protein